MKKLALIILAIVSLSTVTIAFNSIDNVEFTSDLPDQHPAGQNLDITGEASGYNVDEIVLLETSGFNQQIASNQCTGTGYITCELDISESFETGNKEFKLEAYAGDITDDSESQSIEFTDDGERPDIQILSSRAEHNEEGDVEFSLGLNNNIPSSYSCRISSNNRITSFDDDMVRDSDDEFSLTKNFDEGSYTWYMGCLDSSGALVTQTVSESFSVDIDDEDYRITSSRAEHTGNGNVELEIGLNRHLPSGYTCRWSNNDRITSFDDAMDRDSGEEFSSDSSFNDGSHTIYFGCVNLNGNLATNKVSKTFSVDTDEGSYFDVDITDTKSPVEQGNDLEVDYRIENTGDQYDSQRIRLEVEGDRKDRTTNIGLSAGSRSSGTLTWDTSGFDARNYDIIVLSDDDSEERTVEVTESNEDYRVSDVDVNKLDGGNVEFELSTNRNLPSGYKCRWSNNDRISSFDTVMNRDSGDSYSAQSNFDDGTHTVYFGCLNLNNNLVTNKVSRTFTVNKDQGPHFDVEITSTNSPVKKGNNLRVDYRVENTGDQYDTQRVRLEVEGNQKDRTNIIGLIQGSQSSGTLTWDTSGFNARNYDITVLSDDDSDSMTVKVEDKDIDYRISNVNVNQLGDGDVKFRLSTNRNLPSGYKCRWSNNNRITSLDDAMNRNSADSYSAQSNFNSGSHTIYFGCLDRNNNLVTNKVSKTFTVNKDQGQHFDVEITDTNSPVQQGSDLEVDYRVENTGDQYDSQRITLDVEGNRKDRTTSIGLSAGSRSSGTLTWDPTGFNARDYDISVSSEDDSDEDTIEVTREDDYRISNVNVNRRSGGDVEFELDTNRGLPSGYSCRWSNNERISTLDSSMDRDSNDRFSTEESFDTGSHTVYFGCLDENNMLDTNKVRKSFYINADNGPFFDVEITDTNSPIDSGDTLEVDYRVENTGDQHEAQDIELEVAGSVRSSRTESLSAGASDTGTLRWFSTSSRSGEYTARISSEDSSDSVRISIGETNYRISDVDVRKLGGGDVEFELSTNRNLPSGYSCRWSNNNRISTIDNLLDRDSNDQFSAESTFDSGAHTVYFGCLDENNNLVTNKVTKSFSIDQDDPELTLSLDSPLNGAERTPPFTMRWRSSYNEENPEHTVYIRRHGSSGSLFSSTHREAYIGEDTSYRLTRSLADGSYDWGVKAEADGETIRRSSTFVVPSAPSERYNLNVIVEDED
ncbi:MAG: CARDB domain-containing protein, partial [Candidatus Nanohaloarchaea archaeon]